MGTMLAAWVTPTARACGAGMNCAFLYNHRASGDTAPR